MAKKSEWRAVTLEVVPMPIRVRAQALMERRYYNPEAWNDNQLLAYELDGQPLIIHHVTYTDPQGASIEYLTGITETPAGVRETRTLYGRQQVFNHLRKVRAGAHPCRI